MEKLNFEKLSEEKQKDLLTFKAFDSYFDALGFDLVFIIQGLKNRIEWTEDYFVREHLKFVMFSLEAIAQKEHRPFIKEVLGLNDQELAVDFGKHNFMFEAKVEETLAKSTKQSYLGKLYGYSK